MNHIIAIFKWEINKILGNWQKAAAIFLVPAAIMVFAINIFPKLLNYMATGNFGAQSIVVINAPDSFKDYGDKHSERYSYTYKDYTYAELDDLYKHKDLESMLKSGKIVVIFANTEDEVNYLDFDGAVEKYYRNLLAGDTDTSSNAAVEILYDESSYYMRTKAEQFSVDIMDKYTSSLLDTLGGEYAGLAIANIRVDDYNPITYVLKHRSTANYMSARVVSGILGLLMYYCVYSLTLDMLAQEKNRGFLAKLKMTPAAPEHILMGKMSAIVTLVSVSGLITFAFLFFSSWLNRSNDSASLLPFGMLLTPSQLLYLVIAIPTAAFVMSAFCFNVTLSLGRFGDIIANLQIPLMLLLVEFFLQLVLPGSPVLMEYLIPIHNLIAVTRAVFLSDIRFYEFLIVLITNVLGGLLIFRNCVRKFSEDVNV